MKVLFFTQTNQTGASARYRVYQYLSFLERNGVECVVMPAVSQEVLAKYSNRGRTIDKIYYYSSIVLKRLKDLKYVSDFDCVFLQRDILVHLYPFLEQLIARRQKNIIFDFDDAVYLRPSSRELGLFLRFLRDKRKIERIINLSKHIIAGNNFLKNYVEKFTENLTVIPTAIDTNLYRKKDKSKEKDNKIIIGWIGSQINFIYLKNIFPVFIELSKRYTIELKIIGAKGPRIDGVKIEYQDWDLNTEIDDIYSFDIGIMPLANDEWSRGKSGTKLLQYMALGIPSVSSPIGVNAEIVKDGINGFLADTNDDWARKISLLIEDKMLCQEMINNARCDIEKSYSIEANAPKILEVIRKVSSDN